MFQTRLIPLVPRPSQIEQNNIEFIACYVHMVHDNEFAFTMKYTRHSLIAIIYLHNTHTVYYYREHSI